MGTRATTALPRPSTAARSAPLPRAMSVSAAARARDAAGRRESDVAARSFSARALVIARFPHDRRGRSADDSAVRPEDLLGDVAWQAVSDREAWFALVAVLGRGPKHAPTARVAACILGYADDPDGTQEGEDRLLAMFFSLTDHRYGDFVRTWRLLEGDRLLSAHPNWNVAAVAKRVGYSDAASFGRAYAEYFGRTPRGISTLRSPRRCKRSQRQLAFEF